MAASVRQLDVVGARARRSPDRLSRRALNRALLARQWLLVREDATVPQALEHLVGLQAQAPLSPYVGLWTRLAAFEPAALGRLLEQRKAVRIALMRSTIHLVTARDCLAIRPIVQPVHDRGLRGTFGRRLEGLDLAEVESVGRGLVDEQPLSFHGIGRVLAKKWPGRDPLALAMCVRTLVPLVQVPPRGVWGRNGQAVHTSVESWLGRPLAARPRLDRLIVRYLAAFGPATIADVQAWSGLTRLVEAVDRLRPRLRVFQDETGRELFDLPDAPRPDPDVDAPPRFLPEFDNLLLSHSDRTRVIADEHRVLSITGNGINPMFLVDGAAAGTWKIARSEAAATLVLRPFARLAAASRQALEPEGEALLRFLVPSATRWTVQVKR